MTTPLEIIHLALAHKKPPRNMQWLAEQLGVKAQATTNWKTRGVPPKRYREIAGLLDITIDQLEGLADLPWRPTESKSGLLPAVQSLAMEINDLPEAQRDWVLGVVRSTIDAAKDAIRINRTHPASDELSAQHSSTKRAKNV